MTLVVRGRTARAGRCVGVGSARDMTRDAAKALNQAVREAIERARELTARSAELVEEARDLRARVAELKRRRGGSRESSERREGPAIGETRARAAASDGRDDAVGRESAQRLSACGARADVAHRLRCGGLRRRGRGWRGWRRVR
jgi:hypothetical protein